LAYSHPFAPFRHSSFIITASGPETFLEFTPPVCYKVVESIESNSPCAVRLPIFPLSHFPLSHGLRFLKTLRTTKPGKIPDAQQASKNLRSATLATFAFAPKTIFAPTPSNTLKPAHNSNSLPTNDLQPGKHVDAFRRFARAAPQFIIHPTNACPSYHNTARVVPIREKK
jgi:hypothetical protein